MMFFSILEEKLNLTHNILLTIYYLLLINITYNLFYNIVNLLLYLIKQSLERT